MEHVREAPPKAGAMIEALRGLGYSTASALADIIDNSVSANASKIDLIFRWAGKDSKIFVIDDGIGMSVNELDSAMRLGEKNPLTDRAENDLGRFGLGLKTASFSQCRRLSVTSKKESDCHSLYWDLDIIANDPLDRWLLIDGPPPTIMTDINKFENEFSSGTIVVWEIMDRVVTEKFSEQDFLDLMDRVEEHLEMVFHRYLDGSYKSIIIRINGKILKPWDPFMDGSLSKPWHSHPVNHPLDNKVSVQCHVLPHKDKLTPEEYLKYQGPEGWTAQQGFYVYRGGRMLLAGSWLGLGRGRMWTKDEAHRLARIKLDIPTTNDSDWTIDIKKASAKPPVHLRKWLVQMAEVTRHRARRVFAHRGQAPRKKGQQGISTVWHAKKSESGVKYYIDLTNPTIKTVIDSTGTNASALKAMLRLIEETVPVQRIWLDTEEQNETPRNRFYGDTPENLRKVLVALFETMTNQQNISPEKAIDQLKRTDPFHEYQDLVDELIRA